MGFPINFSISYNMMIDLSRILVEVLLFLVDDHQFDNLPFYHTFGQISYPRGISHDGSDVLALPLIPFALSVTYIFAFSLIHDFNEFFQGLFPLGIVFSTPFSIFHILETIAPFLIILLIAPFS